MKKAVIVIPTYNEKGSIGVLIEKIFEKAKDIKGWNIEIVIVDSESPDGTAETVKKLAKRFKNLHLITTKKEGLGKAYIHGFEYALSHYQPDVLFEMDGDLSHNPDKIEDFLKKIESGADFVIGSRYRKGGSIPKDWGLHRKIFSVLGNLIIRFGFMKLKITDWTSGYRAIRSSIIESNISFVKKYTGYVFQVALIDNAIKKNVVIDEVPIHFIDRTHGISKIDSAQYIIQTLRYVFTNSTFIKYFIVGLSGAVLDFGISFLIIEKAGIHQNLYWVATLISAETAIISNFFLNNFWSFSHKKIKFHPHSYLSKFAKFNLISTGALLIQATGIQLATHIFGPELWYVYKFFILFFIVIPYSYILYNKVVWKEKK